MPINILIVDDDDIILSSLKLIMDLDCDINVKGLCKNGDVAYKAILQGQDIDVILMDIQMPVCNGIIATKKILELRSSIKVIVLTTFDDDEYIYEALKNGAMGYMLKNSSPDKIIEAVKVVQGGNLLMHSNIALKIPGLLKKEKKIVLDSLGLSNIELNIMKFIAKGHTNKEISEELYLAEGTVKNKITEIFNKLGLRDRTQIAIYYLNNCGG
ncbi:MAG: response regulator transcription factor [Bacillota bacterium]|nr:response regulator transcription factor [Bacillota bacterium]